MKSTSPILTLSAIALLNSIFYIYPKTALAEDEFDIQKAADKACAFMSGHQRLDPEILQIIEKATLGVDVGNYNQIAIDLDKQLLKQCPKAYITFQHRNIINNPLLQAINPFANPLGNSSAIPSLNSSSIANPLGNSSPTPLTSPNANPTVNPNTTSLANSSATPSANSNSLAISSFNSSDLSLNPSDVTSLNPSVTSSENFNTDSLENPSTIPSGKKHSATPSVTPNATQPDRAKNNSSSQIGDRQEIAKYDEAIRQNPKDVKLYLARGKARYDRQNYQEALADYTEAIRLEPKNPIGYSNRALVKNYLGDKQGTIADLQIAAKLFEANGDRDNHQKVLGLLQQIQANSN
jgi:tetratricopeptide (TPR) repeat protein